MHMKAQVIEFHKIVICGDLPALYEYLFFYRKIWDDQKHRQELNKEELLKIILKKKI